MPVFSDNAAVRDAVLAGNDGHFADRIEAIPLRQAGQYGSAGADPERPPFSFLAMMRVDATAVDLAGAGQQAWATQVPAGKTLLLADPVAQPLVLTLKAGDRVRAAGRNGQPEYVIETIDATKRSRLHILLTRL